MQKLSRENLRFTKKILVILQSIFVQELNDAVFKRISINHVKLNSKKTLATVYLDIANAGPNGRIIEKLQTLNPFLRKRISDELNLFKCPFLRFVRDLHMEKAFMVDKLINDAIDNASSND